MRLFCVSSLVNILVAHFIASSPGGRNDIDGDNLTEDDHITLVVVNQTDEDQQRDVEVHLRKERSGAGLASGWGEAGIQLCGYRDKCQEELLGLLIYRNL